MCLLFYFVWIPVSLGVERIAIDLFYFSLCSLFSWDIVIEKVQGIIFLDKRENSSFDLLTVSETAHEPPSASEEFDEINHPDKLSVEATMINQNFSQQVLMDNVDGVRKTVSTSHVSIPPRGSCPVSCDMPSFFPAFYHSLSLSLSLLCDLSYLLFFLVFILFPQYEANPFAEELEAGMEAASVAYKYRLFTLGNIRLVARCEVHCWTNKRGTTTVLCVLLFFFLCCFFCGAWLMIADELHTLISFHKRLFSSSLAQSVFFLCVYLSFHRRGAVGVLPRPPRVGFPLFRWCAMAPED